MVVGCALLDEEARGLVCNWINEMVRSYGGGFYAMTEKVFRELFSSFMLSL